MGVPDVVILNVNKDIREFNQKHDIDFVPTILETIVNCLYQERSAKQELETYIKEIEYAATESQPNKHLSPDIGKDIFKLGQAIMCQFKDLNLYDEHGYLRFEWPLSDQMSLTNEVMLKRIE